MDGEWVTSILLFFEVWRTSGVCGGPACCSELTYMGEEVGLGEHGKTSLKSRFIVRSNARALRPGVVENGYLLLPVLATVAFPGARLFGEHLGQFVSDV